MDRSITTWMTFVPFTTRSLHSASPNFAVLLLVHANVLSQLRSFQCKPFPLPTRPRICPNENICPEFPKQTYQLPFFVPLAWTCLIYKSQKKGLQLAEEQIDNANYELNWTLTVVRCAGLWFAMRSSLFRAGGNSEYPTDMTGSKAAQTQTSSSPFQCSAIANLVMLHVVCHKKGTWPIIGLCFPLYPVWIYSPATVELWTSNIVNCVTSYFWVVCLNKLPGERHHFFW